MHRARLLLSLLALAILLAGLLPSALGAQGALPDPAGSARRVVRVDYGGTQWALDSLAERLDIWEVHAQEGTVVALVSPQEEAWLRAEGYTVEVLRVLDAGIEAPLDARYYYFDDYYTNANDLYVVDFLQAVNSAYPDIVELIDIGDAWMAGQAGEHHRDLWVLRISNEDLAYGDILAKPAFVLHSEVHAREVTTPELAIRYIQYLTGGYNGQGGYGVDPDVTWLVDWHVAYIEVMANPDGHWVNEQDINAYRRKNMDWDDGCNDPGSWGVDLNRNHSFLWGCCGGSSGQPCSETYRGPLKASEPETSAFQDYVMQVVPDQNGPNGDDEVPPAAPLDTKGFLLSLHSYADEILWPWGWTSDPAPNDAGLEAIARKMADIDGYYEPTGAMYTVDGATRDWSYGKLGIPSYVLEVGPDYGTCGGFFPSYDCQDGINSAPRNFWAENRPLFLYAHKITRSPYVTVYGPDADTLAVTPPSVPQYTPVALSAHLQDHRYGGDPTTNIAGAEYFVDQPGDDGSGTAMQAQDGSWGGASETAIATVDTSGLLPGQHYILVHGLGANGEWGPFTAVFLTVTSGQCQPVEILEVDTEEDGCVVTFTAELSGTAPFDYYWDFCSFGTSTLPTPTVDFALAGTYPYTLTVTNCVTGTDTYNGEVEVYCCTEPHDAAFTFAPPDPVIGQGVAFTGTASGTLPITFTWAFGDGQFDSGAQVTHAYAAGGDYTVWMTASNACGTAAVSDVVSVCRPASNADFFWSPTDPQPDEWIAFHGSAEGSEPIAYAWDFGDGQYGAGANTSHRYPLAGLYTVVMTASNCAGDTSVASHMVNVGAVSCEPVDITAVATDVSQCLVTFTAELTGTAPYTYLWAFGDGVTCTLAGPSHDYGATGSYTVTLDAWNCPGNGDYHDTYTLAVSVDCTPAQRWSVYLPLIWGHTP